MWPKLTFSVGEGVSWAEWWHTQKISLEPVDVILFDKRVYAAMIKDLEMRSYCVSRHVHWQLVLEEKQRGKDTEEKDHVKTSAEIGQRKTKTFQQPSEARRKHEERRS